MSHPDGIDDSEAIVIAETHLPQAAPPAPVGVSTVASLNRSEVETQLDAAHRYPRSINRFLADARALVTSPQVAESCIYSLPRGGKSITGPSVRMAEIAASCYGNLHVGARVVDVEEKEVVAQAVAWDLQKNLRITVEVRRRITKKNGQRYDDDMINVTGAAAMSIALRNAIFRVIPRSLVDNVYNHAHRVAVGDVQSISKKRENVLARFNKMGITDERIFARMGVDGPEDLDNEKHIATLIGLGTAIKDGSDADDVFPLVGTAIDKPTSERMSLGSGKGKGKKKDSEPIVSAAAIAEVKAVADERAAASVIRKMDVAKTVEEVDAVVEAALGDLDEKYQDIIGAHQVRRTKEIADDVPKTWPKETADLLAEADRLREVP